MQEAALWKQYIQTKDPKLKEELILKYMPLVKIIAGRLSLYFGTNVEYDDLISYGTLGLLDAIEKYDINKGVKFETYAYLRIKGTIIDNIRSLDWVPRSIRQKAKEIEKAYHDLENEGKKATNQEIAKKLNITVEELSKIQDKVSAGMIISLDNYIDQNSESKIGSIYDFVNQPEDFIENDELKNILKKEIDNLNDNERMVITLYYFEELTVKEISKIMGISESRVSQLHTRSLMKLRGKINQYFN